MPGHPVIGSESLNSSSPESKAWKDDLEEEEHRSEFKIISDANELADSVNSDINSGKFESAFLKSSLAVHLYFQGEPF